MKMYLWRCTYEDVPMKMWTCEDISMTFQKLNTFTWAKNIGEIGIKLNLEAVQDSFT